MPLLTLIFLSLQVSKLLKLLKFILIKVVALNAATATKRFCLCLILNNTNLSIQTRDLLNVTSVINRTMIKPLYDDTVHAILDRKSSCSINSTIKPLYEDTEHAILDRKSSFLIYGSRLSEAISSLEAVCSWIAVGWIQRVEQGVLTPPPHPLTHTPGKSQVAIARFPEKFWYGPPLRSNWTQRTQLLLEGSQYGPLWNI